MSETSNEYKGSVGAFRQTFGYRLKFTDGEGKSTMKRLISILLALTLFIAIMPATAFAASSKTVYVSRSGGNIYMHKGPGYDYETTGYTVSHGAKVTIKDEDDEWTKIKVNSTGRSGWIRTMYVDGTTKRLAKGYKELDIDSGETVRLYSTWNVNSSTIEKLTAGDTVRVNGTSHDFARVTVTGSGNNGWIPIRYIGDTVELKADAPSGKDTTVYHVTAGTLNMRSGPGTGYGIVSQLAYGTGCTLIKSSGNWRKVKTFDGRVGWVSRTYLVRRTSAWVATNGSNLNVRKGPGTYSAVLGSLPNGTKVTVKYTNGNWAYITGGKLTGYVSMNYLRF